MQAPRRRGRVTVLLALLLVVLGGCGTVGAPDPTDGPAPAFTGAVRAAARALIATGGARVTISAHGPARHRPVVTTGSGVVDLRGRAADVTLDVTGIGGVRARTIARTAYAALPARAIDDLAGGRPWVSVELDRVDPGLFADTVVQLGSGATGNPADVPTMLVAGLADGVRSLGPDVVGGVPTTHYRGVVDLGRVAAAAPDLRAATDRLRTDLALTSLPVDVWLDGTGRLVQVSESLRPDGTATAVTTFSGPGPQAEIAAPPARQVRDLLGDLDRS